MLENKNPDDALPIEVQPAETGLTPVQNRLRTRRTRLPEVPDDVPAVAPGASAASAIADATKQAAPPNDAQAQMQVSDEVKTIGADESVASDDGDDEGDPRKRSGKGGRKRLLFAAGAVVFLVAFCAVAAGAAWYVFYRPSSTGSRSAAARLGMTRTGGRAETSDPTASPEMPVTPDEIKKKTGQAVTPDSTGAGILSLPEGNAGDGTQQMPPAYGQIGGAPITERLPYEGLSQTVTPTPQKEAANSADRDANSGGMIGSSPRSSSENGRSASSDPSTASPNYGVRAKDDNRPDERGTPSQEHSIRAFAVESGSPQAKRLADDFDRAAPRAAEPQQLRRDEASGVSLPPLGTMLPIRTLGAIYSLRSGSLVRMQLTRDVSGAGWSLRRGTELYGTLRGSDYDISRAYISLVGFVEPRTNRLVRMSGDLLGSDGAEGMRGTKRRFSSKWSRALRIAGVGALDVLGTAAANLGRQTVIVSDLYGDASNRAISPLTQELNRTASGNRAAGFVEVPSAATGYVLVLTMPAEEQGRPAEPDNFLAAYPRGEQGDALAHYTIAAPPAASTSLTDAELAELMQLGSPDQVRRSWSRMSPAMRRVAVHLLEQR